MSQPAEVDRERVHVGDTIRHVDDEYSTDTRARVAEHVLEYWPRGGGIREIGREADVSEATVRSVLEDYFKPVRAGDDADEQRVIEMGEDYPGEVEPPEDDEMADEPADRMDEEFESRVATLADWFGVSESRARTLATAEQEAGIEFTGDERIQGGDQPEPEPEPEPETTDESDQPQAVPGGAQEREWATMSHMMPTEEDVPYSDEVLSAYRLGFQDGFTTAWQLNQ